MYDLNQLALISGLTTRTLRSYLHLGLLQGEKIDGVWRFTEEEACAFLTDPAVSRLVSARRNAVVLDFLADSFKKANRSCLVLDCPVDAGEARAISDFFCKAITDGGRDIEFRFTYERGLARVILAGAEDQVADIMRAYYGR